MPNCPRCGAQMRRRRSVHGEFWGCSAYPRCKGTKNCIKYPDNIPAPAGSEFNHAIWNQMCGTSHGMVNSVAGSGKTYTIVNGVRLIRDESKVGVLSFNNHIIREINQKFKEEGIHWARGVTYNALGFRAMMQAHPGLNDSEPFQDKVSSIVAELHNDEGEDADALRAGVVRMVDLAKCYLDDGDDEESLRFIMDHHGVDFVTDTFDNWEDYDRIVDYALGLVKPALDICLSRRTIWDFNDQVWWTVKLGLAVETFDVLMIDEAQDTNPLRKAIAHMACPRGRIWIVGDNRQAIYGFTGCTPKSMPTWSEELATTERGCINLNLPVCRRSPKSHVRLVQPIVPGILACTKERDGVEAPEGEIWVVNIEEAVKRIKPGDMGMSRRRADVIPLAYALIKNDIKVIVRGRDIGKGLESLVKKLRGRTIEDLLVRLKKYRDKQMGKLVAAGKAEDHPQVQSLQDRCDCIEFLCEGMEDISSLLKRIQTLFADFDDEGKPKAAVVLGTIHKMKGLEAHNVWILAPECIPLRTRRQWEAEQEENLAYIAGTRAVYKLAPDGSVIEPGRLFFLGPIPAIYRADWVKGGQHPPIPTPVDAAGLMI